MRSPFRIHPAIRPAAHSRATIMTTIPSLLRKTVSPQASVVRVEARLDHASSLAIAYARRYLKDGPAGAGVDFLSSGVVRRALAVYMSHLANLEDPSTEARAIHACCAALPVEPGDQEAAWKRLEAHKAGSPMPTYQDVLRGPGWAVRVAAVSEKAEALAQVDE